MAINWTEADIERVVKAVISNIATAPKATANAGEWNASSYHGRKLIGV